MSWLANIAYLVGGMVYLPVLVYAMLVQGKNRRGWREKLLGPRAQLQAVGARGAIWVHAVSLGEINAARGIIAGLQQRFGPQRVVISTTTDTGYARAVELFGAACVFRFPLDFSWTVRRALRRIDPCLIVLMELEVWFNLTTIAARRGIPVCVVNGRLTERSSRRFGWIAPVARRMFAALRWVGAQDQATADRFERVGVPRERVTLTGSVKWDTAAIADRVPGQQELARAMGISPYAPLWVCGSTGPGEEAQLLDMYDVLRVGQPTLQVAIIPRKPERFNEVADLIRKRGFACVRRSQRPDTSLCGTDFPVGRAGKNAGPTEGMPAVLLGDTMGELRKFYALAHVVYVGRTLVPLGGSDPMEVAALGKPVVTGPHMENFAQAVEVLGACGALVQCDSAPAVRDQVLTWLIGPSDARAAGRRGQQVVLANQGATQRTVGRLVALAEGATGEVCK